MPRIRQTLVPATVSASFDRIMVKIFPEDLRKRRIKLTEIGRRSIVSWSKHPVRGTGVLISNRAGDKFRLVGIDKNGRPAFVDFDSTAGHAALRRARRNIRRRWKQAKPARHGS